MENKYYILIDENRRIITRYTLDVHGDSIPKEATEVKKEVFNISIQENHNYLNEDFKTELRDMRTPEEIAEAERLAKLPTSEELQKNTIELVTLGLLAELGVI